MTDERILEIATLLQGRYPIHLLRWFPHPYTINVYRYFVSRAVDLLGAETVELAFDLSDGIDPDEVESTTLALTSLVVDVSPLPDWLDRILYSELIDQFVKGLVKGRQLDVA